ncbi:hypothetical protein [Listeria booriae]|nr:hypothetical protein [Listeria booriae]
MRKEKWMIVLMSVGLSIGSLAGCSATQNNGDNTDNSEPPKKQK